MDVVEICPGAETDPAVIDELIAITEALGKAPAVLRWPVPGYLLNRLQYALMREAWNLVESGVCDFADVDRAADARPRPALGRDRPLRGPGHGRPRRPPGGGESLMPVLEGQREPPAELQQMVADGDRGTSTGRGLRGDYDEARMAELTARRGAGHASGKSRPLSGSRGAAAPSCAGRVCHRPSPGCGWDHRP